METEEVVKKEDQGATVKFEGSVPFATHNEAATNAEIAAKILAAPQLHFNTQAETWSPEKIGERKRLIFQGIIDKAKTKNKFADDPEFVYLDKAVFVEVYENKESGEVEQRVIESYATTIISYMQNNLVPRHAVMDIEFNGEKKGDTFKYHSFKIIPVPVQF